MKIVAVDSTVLAVPTPKPMALEFREHRLVVAHVHTDEGISQIGQIAAAHQLLVSPHVVHELSIHYNPIGTVHGGVISTLPDSPLSCAVHTTLPASSGYTVNFAFGILFKPILGELGVDRSTLALAATASLLVNAAGQPSES